MPRSSLSRPFAAAVSRGTFPTNAGDYFFLSATFASLHSSVRDGADHRFGNLY
jgi:hypothetical protein